MEGEGCAFVYFSLAFFRGTIIEYKSYGNFLVSERKCVVEKTGSGIRIVTLCQEQLETSSTVFT